MGPLGSPWVGPPVGSYATIFSPLPDFLALVLYHMHQRSRNGGANSWEALGEAQAAGGRRKTMTEDLHS